jgi:hypothetical protein
MLQVPVAKAATLFLNHDTISRHFQSFYFDQDLQELAISQWHGPHKKS